MSADTQPMPFLDSVEVRRVPDPVIPETGFPFIVVAYWPKGKFWSVKPEMYSSPDCRRINDEIQRLHDAGWIGIKIVKLP